MTTVTPAVTAAATFPALNGVAVNGAAAAGSIFRPTFARNPSTVATTAAAAFPGTPLLLQQSPQPMIQNGTVMKYVISTYYPCNKKARKVYSALASLQYSLFIGYLSQ